MKNYVQVTLCYVFISLLIIMLSALLYTQALGGENVDNQRMRSNDDQDEIGVPTQEDIWSPPVNVSNTAGSSYTPRLVVDSRNTLHMVWQDWVDLGVHWQYILYANKSAGGEWSPPTPLSGFVQGGNPAITIGRDDILHIVWYSSTFNTSYIHRKPDGIWSWVENVTTSGSSYDPDVAVASDGSVHIAWRERFGLSENEIYYSARLSDGGWSTPVLVSLSGCNSSDPLVAVDTAGTAHLLWYQSDTGIASYASKPVGGDWSSPEELPFKPWLQDKEQLASDLQGNLHLAWTEYDWETETSRVLYVTKYLTSTSWSEPQMVASGSYPYFNANHVAIATDGQGNVHLTWEGNGKLWYVFRDSYWGWISPSNVHTRSDWHGNDEFLSLTADAQGGKYIAWDTGIEGDIWYTGMTGIPPTEAIVTSAGGRLKSIGTTLTFPTGAVVTDTLIILTPKPSHSVSGLFTVRSFDLSAKRANDGDPITTFALPYTITVQYTDAEMGPAIENTLALYWWNGVQWMREPTSNLDAVRNQITAHPDHMTTFAVLGETWRVYLPIAAR